MNKNEPLELNDPDVARVIPLAFSAEEVTWIEDNFPALAADQPDNFCSVFDDLGAIRGLNLDHAALEGVEREFIAAGAWHEARGRPELAQRYRRRAAALRQVLVEKLN